MIAAHDVGATEVLLLPSRAMPKTSSGKLTRAACRAGIADGSIATIARWRVDQPTPAAREPGGTAGLKSGLRRGAAARVSGGKRRLPVVGAN